jgi:hypothetical protein
MALGTKIVVPAHGDIRFASGMSSVETIDLTALERHLRRPVHGEVRFDRGSLAMYANDSSTTARFPSASSSLEPSMTSWRR